MDNDNPAYLPPENGCNATTSGHLSSCAAKCSNSQCIQPLHAIRFMQLQWPLPLIRLIPKRKCLRRNESWPTHHPLPIHPLNPAVHKIRQIHPIPSESPRPLRLSPQHIRRRVPHPTRMGFRCNLMPPTLHLHGEFRVLFLRLLTEILLDFA